MQKVYVLVIGLLAVSICNSGFSQSVMDPSDPIVNYDSTHPPTQPAWGQIGKWVRTPSLNWNTSSYKAYIYKGCAFRLKFPKTYNPIANDGKKYPMMIFFHGLGESRPIYDNEFQLYHGGEVFRDAVDNGTFDGYILCMQSSGNGFWNSNQYQFLSEIIDYMVANNKLDAFHVSDNGLSAGGEGTWGMLIEHPTYICASLPMSSSSINYETSTIANSIKFTPLWLFQGGLDGSPAPYTSQNVRDYMLTYGADFSYKEYPTLGHGTWDSVWQEPDFWPYQLRAYASNPWTLFGRTEFCVGNPINLTIGVPPGFDQYQWSKNGVTINTATSNTINVTDTGTYAARVRRGSVWSDWSHTPAHIKIKDPTITPPINVSGLMSTAIPAPDGKNYVNLEIPDNGYTSYTWKKVGSNNVIGTDRILKVTQPGDYSVSVTEQYGCSSVFSPIFHVTDANGANAPDAAKSLTALTLSYTQIELDWSNNPRPNYNETVFEIYRSLSSGGSYALVGKVPADTLTFIDSNLTPNVKYYYTVRAINNNGAAALSDEASAITQSDNTPPTAPANLSVVSSTNSTVSLKWDTSTDNVGLAEYEIYVDGIKTYSTTQTSFNVSGLQAKQQYTFYVKAKDVSGNYSSQSNQVDAATVLRGLQYRYYEGYWNTLPDFNTVSFVKAGITANTDIGVRNRNDQFGFLWQGFINVPVAGSYKFETLSDDGSKLWLGTYNASSTPLVNNDGVHTAQYADGKITLQAGVYPISIAYFDQTGAQKMNVYWSCSKLFGDNNRHLIADQYFKDSIATGTIPAAATSITASALSYHEIKLNWNDNSNNETGFEIYRSPTSSGNFTTVYTTAPNQTTYTDTTLSPSTTYYYKIVAINNSGSSHSTIVKSATTRALPAAPAAPTKLSATAQSASQISLSWIDKANIETGYTVYRSINNSANFKQLALLPVNSNSYVDSSLFAHITYYYKVVVNGVGGSTNSSAIVSATTGDNLPVITDIINRSAPFGTSTIIPVTANDIDGDSLTYTILQKPSFATFTSNNNNTATLTLNPASSDQGIYNNIKIIVDDNNGGKDTTTFNLTINSNYNPVIDAISDYTLNENGNVNINLTAHDQNAGDVLTWSVSNAPNAYTLTPGANGFATLSLHPNYASAGIYNVQVSVNDGNGGTATKQFTVTVNDQDPNSTVYVRFMDQDAIGTPWNNVTSVTTNNLKDANNNTTSIGLALQTSWFSVFNEGPQTGNNSGVYPDAVLKDYYYFGIFGGPETVTAKLTGLNTSLKYNLTFYGASSWSGAPDNGTTTYTIGSQTVSLYVQGNTKNTVSLNNIVPAQDGTITFTMAKAANTPVGYINALVINSIYDDGSAPLAPKSLIAQNTPSQGVLLSWQDVAYNETGYEVYRSVNAGGGFTLINTTASNATSYTDTSARGNTQYYYKIRSINTHGQSAYSDVVSILTIDRIPQIASISNIVMNNSQTLNINVTTNDDATDQVRLTASGLPPFVTFTDNGNGTGSLNIAPTTGVSGYYPGLTITAKDNSDSSSSKSFSITVTDNNVSSVYLNFSDGTQADKPWNNLTAYPVANTVYSNIVDDNNNATGITVKLLDGFQGVVASGMHPGNGKGIYPEVVMRTGDFEGSTNTRRIQITGLNTAKKYNFVFFNSHDDGLNCLTNFTINGQTVSLNATYNLDKTVQINGISPDASGNVTISVAKAAGMDYAFISSLIIQSYTPGTFLGPTELRIINPKRTSLTLQWADRADSETNYEVWRANDGGSFSLLTTVAANVTSYTDANLTSNQTYYYQVRAKKAGPVYSNYSNVAGGTTYAYSVYVNFTISNNAPTPWNNTDALPQLGYVWNNFYDETAAPTSVGMVETGTFGGLYGAGITTGNNSGVFPDNVMIDSYGLFPGQSATMKVTGLNLTQKYDFTFFGSSNAYGDVNTAYTVNGKTCLLNTSLNKTGTVTMYNIVPDENGEVTITIAPGTASSQFGLLGALIIQGANVSSLPAPAAQLVKNNPIASGSIENIQKQTLQQNISDIQIKAYPNPFNSNFNLSVTTKQNEDVSVEMYNMSGKLVYANKFNNLFQGENTLKIQPGVTAAGEYIVKIIFSNEKLIRAVKILKY